ncbi:MAG: S9 family peptidase [Dehalococcoidales bacterium]|nr:S9 family peptidase [Dehalococcoidales bacterium]
MAEVKEAGYGSWKSMITSDLVASSSIRFDGFIETDGKNVYWIEMRPSEAGRYVLVRRSPDGTTEDVNPAPYNVRTRVHEYGGGACLIDRDTVYFSNFSDQRLYRQEPGSPLSPLTPEGDMRYADGVIDRQRNRIICVCEDHTKNDKEPENYIASVDLNGTGEITRLVSGNDFYSSPRISPDGSQLAWITWNHPNMPWDYTELWIANISDEGSIINPEKLAGGSDDAVSEPKYSPNGVLYFLSEKTGWLNLCRYRNGAIEPLCEMAAEFGSPHWIFGQSTYAFESEKRIVCTYSQNGESCLSTIDTETLELKQIETEYSSFSSIITAHGYAVFLAASPIEAASVVRLDLSTGKTGVLRKSTDIIIDAGYLSVPEAIEFPTENGLTAHALYYRPKNTDFKAPAGEKPPLMVISHGGPTSATSGAFSLSIQYWTSRGFAVADVNYGGSTGYGREYRRRLDGMWGIVDVDDCANCARYLIERGEADGERAAIRGGSAGGYTTLASLAFRDVFRAGASYYGVSDLEALETDTHKFESRYLDRIVAPYPEKRNVFTERSPIHHVEKLSCPVIFFQGDEDKVVPPDQAGLMVNALREKGIPVAYLLFEGEQHGFRKAENIKRALDAELYFYSKIFGFEPADHIEPVMIENLD